MALYSQSNFIKSFASTDKAIQIQNTFGQKVFTINVCNYQKSFVNSNFLVIASEDTTRDYTLEFDTNDEAIQAQLSWKTALDTLYSNCNQTEVTNITTLTAASITYVQYKAAQAAGTLSPLSWYDVSDTNNNLNLGAVIRVLAKTDDDAYPEGIVLDSLALVTLDVINDFVSRFELVSKKILAENNSIISYDNNCSNLLAQNQSQINATNSANILVSNNSTAIVSGCNGVVITGTSSVTLEHATDLNISDITQSLTFAEIGFNFSNVSIDVNNTQGKAGKTTGNIGGDASGLLNAYNHTIDQHFLFTANNKTLSLSLTNKILNANSRFRVKLLLDSGITGAVISIYDYNSEALLYTMTDFHNDIYAIFEYNKTTTFFEFVRLDTKESSPEKIIAVTPTNGQTVFYLSIPPTTGNLVKMFINGVKCKFGIDYTFTSPNIVTYLNQDYTLGILDSVEFIIG